MKEEKPVKHNAGFNLDKHGCSRCIKAGYYKFGVGNFLYHPNDGFTAPCVIEYEIEDTDDEEQAGQAGPDNSR